MNEITQTNDSEFSVVQENHQKDFLPGIEALGAGYDILGEYASAKSITFQLFDWRKEKPKKVSFKSEYVVPEIVDVQQQDRADYKHSEGSSITKFQESFSSEVEISGAYNLFSASIANEFSSSSLRNAENEFSRIQESITTYSLKILPDYHKLRSLLLEKIRNEIDSAKTDQDFENLFNQYGSHFLSGIIMGGKAALSSATNKLQIDKTYSNETITKANYENLTGSISAEDKAKYEQSLQSFQANSETSKSVKGGDAVLASQVFSNDQENFNAWKESVGSSPDFVDFMPNAPMTGIWELCEDSTQKNNMQKYFEETWGQRKSKEAQFYADYIDQLVVISGGNSSIQPPAGFSKIPDDLNKGAGGKHIYLCYHKVSVDNVSQNNPKCISDITTVTGKDTPAPSGYEKIGVDLNKGASGEFIYFCFKEAEYSNKEAIKAVSIISGDNPDLPPPYDFEKVEQDLNQDAGGDYIYACYSKAG